MILLPLNNRILSETVAAQVINPRLNQEGKRDAIDVKICDFDEVAYSIKIDEKTRETMTIAISCPSYGTIEDKGAQAALQGAFGDMVSEPPDNFDAAITVTFDSLPEEEKDLLALVEKISMMKTIVLGGVFRMAFDDMNAGKKPKAFHFDLRGDTRISLHPGKKDKRLTLIFKIDFNNDINKTIAKVFMQEFVDAKRKVRGGPSFAWSANPPAELKDFNITTNENCLGYCSIGVLPSHCTKKNIHQTVNVLTTFRTYVSYHITCSKSYFHQRMRARTVSLLKVLNRAKVKTPSQEGGKKAKKTASGKKFVRR